MYNEENMEGSRLIFCVTLCGVFFVHLTITEDISSPSIASTSNNANPNITQTTESVLDEDNLYLVTASDTVSNSSINVTKDVTSNFSVDQTSLNQLTNSVTKLKTNIVNLQNNDIDENNVTNSTSMVRSEFFVHITSDFTLENSTVLINDTFLSLYKKDANQTIFHYDFNNESIYVNEMSAFEAENKTLFIQTNKELNVSNINDSMITSHVSKETDINPEKVIKTTKTIRTGVTTPPPPLIVSPPPLPPDEIYQDLEEESVKQQNVFEKEPTNVKFQPRARNIPEEMKKALLDPNNIIISTANNPKKVKLELYVETILGPVLSSPPPPPPILNDKPTKQLNESELATNAVFMGNEQPSMVNNQEPQQLAKSYVRSLLPSKRVVHPPQPPYKTFEKSDPIGFPPLPIPPPPPLLHKSKKKSTLDNIKEKQILLQPPPPPPPPPRRKPLPLPPRTPSPPRMSARLWGQIPRQDKISTITKRTKNNNAMYKKVHKKKKGKSLAKYLSYFDRDSLYHQSPWSIKASTSLMSRPSTRVRFNKRISGTIKQNIERASKSTSKSTNPISPISNDDGTSQLTERKMKVIQHDQENNVQVRKMIDTIEKVRAQALSGNIFQFFVPSTVTSKLASTTVTQFDKPMTKETEEKSAMNSNDPPPILLVPSAAINSHAYLSRSRRTDRNVSKRMSPFIRINNNKRAGQNNRYMTLVKTTTGNDKALHTNESTRLARLTFRSLNKEIASSGDLKNSFDELNYRKIYKSKQNKSKVDSKDISLLHKQNMLPAYENKKSYTQFKDKRLFLTTKKYLEKNSIHPKHDSDFKSEPPPPIFMQAKNSPTFEIKHVPPPPPVPKYTHPQAVTQILKTTEPPNTTHENMKETVMLKSQSRKTNMKKETASFKRDLDNPEEKCRSCTYVSNFCYLREPSNCNRYILCYKQGRIIRATEKECSFGLLWSESKLACIQASRADCVTDPCRTRGVRSHPYIGKCRAYWTCRRRRSDARCCPKGYGFDEEGKACVPKADCLTECQTEAFVADNVCHLKEDASSPYKYYDDGMLRSCAPGTRFKQSVCTCVRSNTNVVSNKGVDSFQCKPDIKLDFSGKSYKAFDDKSGNSQSLGVNDVVQTLKEQAMFNGRGNLVLWRFSNVELGPELAVKFKFYAHGQSMRSETLFSNCIGSKDVAAIDIRLETDILEIVFNVKTTKSQGTHMRMFYRPFQWNDVVMRYDGESLSASIGEVSKTVYVEGVIPTKHAFISIGGCGKEDGFIGYMDDTIRDHQRLVCSFGSHGPWSFERIRVLNESCIPVPLF